MHVHRPDDQFHGASRHPSALVDLLERQLSSP